MNSWPVIMHCREKYYRMYFLVSRQLCFPIFFLQKYRYVFFFAVTVASFNKIFTLNLVLYRYDLHLNQYVCINSFFATLLNVLFSSCRIKKKKESWQIIEFVGSFFLKFLVAFSSPFLPMHVLLLFPPFFLWHKRERSQSRLSHLECFQDLLLIVYAMSSV